MSETNGTAKETMTAAARSILRAMGGEPTWEEFKAHPEARQLDVSRQTYYNARAAERSDVLTARFAPKPEAAPAKAPAPPAVIPDRPDAPPPVDYLAKLLRFGLAVEQVGGIESARRMLDALDQLRRNQK